MTTHLTLIGGSVAGLSLALFAARRGVRVTVLEGDERARPGPVDEAAARRPRWVTPQAAHSHAFLARARHVLAAEAPDVLAALAEGGAHTLDLAAHRPTTRPGDADGAADDDLAVLLSRRTTFEGVLRNAAAAEEAVTLRVGARATGLELDATGAVPRVVGVRCDDGTTVGADVVADASGRRGRVHRWLTEAGIQVATLDEDCGIAYHSRFYRLRLGARWGPLNRGYTAGASFDRYSALVFPGDGASFSVTLGVLPEDRALAGLRDERGFAAAVEAIPLVAPWVAAARAEPISPVHTMTRMRNRLRRTVVDGRPTVTGLVQVADAAATSNPAHSRGCALALSHAARLAADVRDHAHDPDALAGAADHAVGVELAPWVEDSRQQDRARLARWRPDAGVPPPATPPGGITNGEAYAAAQHDPEVWRRFTRLQQLLDTPERTLTDPDLVARVREVQRRGLGPPRHDAPDHDELAALADVAAASVARAS